MRTNVSLATAALGAALVFAPVGVQAQDVADNFSYKAPSGMFSEGTTKWQMYQFMESDAERTAKLRAGEPVSTSSISNSDSNAASYPRPGERSRGFRRQTAR